MVVHHVGVPVKGQGLQHICPGFIILGVSGHIYYSPLRNRELHSTRVSRLQERTNRSAHPSIFRRQPSGGALPSVFINISPFAFQTLRNAGVEPPSARFSTWISTKNGPFASPAPSSLRNVCMSSAAVTVGTNTNPRESLARGTSHPGGWVGALRVAQALETRDRRRVHVQHSCLADEVDESEPGAGRVRTDSHNISAGWRVRPLAKWRCAVYKGAVLRGLC